MAAAPSASASASTTMKSTAAKGKQRAASDAAAVRGAPPKKSMAANAGQGKTSKNKNNAFVTNTSTSIAGKRVAAPSAGSDPGNANDVVDALRRDIIDLGGDDEDYAYVKDIDTDEEVMVNETAEDKTLAKDLKSFLATLGDLGKAYGADIEEDSEPEPEEVSADEEEDGESSTAEDGPGAEEEVSNDSDDEEVEEEQPVKTAEQPVVSAKPVKEATTATVQKNGHVSRSGMLIDPNPRWYDSELPDLPSAPADFPSVPARTIEQLQTRGSQLLTEIGETFSGSLQSDPSDKKSAKNDKLAMSSTLSASDRTFISTILQSGTSSDKLSALILLSSSSPLHTTTYLNQLLNLTKKKSRDEAVRAIRAIVDWLKGGSGGAGTAGLPDRKLRWFAEQPGLKDVSYARTQSSKSGNKQTGKQAGDEHLLLWAFEDWLKKWYFELLKSIEGLSHDPLPFVRTQMTGFLAGLLSSKAEQEQNLLRLLVDKLGDSEKTVSSRTSYHLLQLLSEHPMMKNIVVKEVAALVLRPTGQSAPVTSATGQGKKIKFGDNGAIATSASRPSATAGIRSGDHSRYYGIITLNQIMLSRTQQDSQVANRLIEVYFDIFNDLLGSHDTTFDEDAGTGSLVDRKARREEKSGKRKRNAVEQARLKAMPRKERRKLEKTQQALEAESKIMAAVLTGVNRAFPYSDMDGDVLHKRVDVLFRIIHTGTFNVGIQALLLVFQVSSKQQAVSDRFYRVLYDTLIDPRLAGCSKQAMYLNLLFKALKADTSAKRTAAFVKRLTQVLGEHQPPFVCGALYLLGELFSVTPGLRSMLSEPEDADDDVETFRDAPDPDADAASSAAEEESAKKPEAVVNGGRSTKYDGKKRDPQYANAQNSCLWELAPLISHFHPSVALHASQLLNSQPITTTPDLELHTLSHFLDRFVYRNAKKTAQSGKDSQMKPGARGQDRSGMVVLRKGDSANEGALNAAEFIKKKAEDIPVDQMFFHRFFTKKQENEKTRDAKKTENKRKRRGDADVDDSDIDIDDEDIEMGGEDSDAESAVEEEDGELEAVEEGDLDEDEVWKAMQASMPPAGGDAEDADLLEASDDDSVADFAYSDSDVGIDEDAKGAIDADEDEDDEDEEPEEDADEPQSFFPEDDEGGMEDFGEEEEDFFDSDEDIVLGDGVELVSAEDEGAASRKQKKRKLKHLPAFASADDWAELINAGDDDEE